MDGAEYGDIRSYRRMYSLVMILVDVTWQIRDVVKGKGTILNL